MAATPSVLGLPLGWAIVSARGGHSDGRVSRDVLRDDDSRADERPVSDSCRAQDDRVCAEIHVIADQQVVTFTKTAAYADAVAAGEDHPFAQDRMLGDHDTKGGV